MSGYREHSFDPNAGGDYGPPMRPFNWVQWTGVVFALVGVTFDLVYLGGRVGLFPKLLDSPSLGVSLPLIAVALINSRREPGQLSRETMRKRSLIILAAFAVCILVAAAVIYFKGA